MTTAQLIEDYQRRISTASEMLEKKQYNSITGAERLRTKISCYRAFMAELQRVV